MAGFIFDSAPAYMHWHMGRRVLEAETPPGPGRTLRVAAFTVVALVGKVINPSRPERYWCAGGSCKCAENPSSELDGALELLLNARLLYPRPFPPQGDDGPAGLGEALPVPLL